MAYEPLAGLGTCTHVGQTKIRCQATAVKHPQFNDLQLCRRHLRVFIRCLGIDPATGKSLLLEEQPAQAA